MKKVTSTKSNKEMAKVFRKVGDWFMDLPDDTQVGMGVDYSNAEIKRGKHHGMPASPAGFLAILYKTPTQAMLCHCRTVKQCRYSKDGARAFAKDLGFHYDSVRDLVDWLYENPDLWGSGRGSAIFSRWESAYNEGEKEYRYGELTTKAIGEKFLAVAGRLEKTKEV